MAHPLRLPPPGTNSCLSINLTLLIPSCDLFHTLWRIGPSATIETVMDGQIIDVDFITGLNELSDWMTTDENGANSITFNSLLLVLRDRAVRDRGVVTALLAALLEQNFTAAVCHGFDTSSILVSTNPNPSFFHGGPDPNHYDYSRRLGFMHQGSLVARYDRPSTSNVNQTMYSIFGDAAAAFRRKVPGMSARAETHFSGRVTLFRSSMGYFESFLRSSVGNRGKCITKCATTSVDHFFSSIYKRCYLFRR